jgi:hypothetical protein
MLGDNAYYTGTDEQYQAAVFEMYPSMLRQTVLWPTIGNHDTAFSYNPPPTLPYFNIFSLPKDGEAGGVPSGTEKYYSYDYANIHFVCMDSMGSDRSSNGPMCTWLQADLEANTNEWLIAYWHHPPYSKGSHDSDWEFELIQMRTNVLPILEAHGVDLVLTGHSHSYERSFLLDGHYGPSTSLSPDMIMDPGSGREDGDTPYTKPLHGGNPRQGAVYIVAGSSGQISGGWLNHPAMFVSLNQLGSLVLDIDGNRLDAKFLRADGVVADHFTLMKGVPSRRLRITNMNVTGSVLTLAWNSIPGKFYYVLFTPTLHPPAWDYVGFDIYAEDTTTLWSVPIPEELPAGFFRIVTFD